MAGVLHASTGRAVPTPSQLAALGTVLCLHRAGAARELGGWSSASRAEAHAGLDGDGMHESLWFFDAADACCWQLHLLPDSDFLGWERLSTQLPRCSDVAPGGIAERLWRSVAQRLRGGACAAAPGRPACFGSSASVQWRRRATQCWLRRSARCRRWASRVRAASPRPWHLRVSRARRLLLPARRRCACNPIDPAAYDTRIRLS